MSKPLIIDLGPHFEVRWKRAPLRLKREIMAELRDIYHFMDEDDDLPVLAAAPAAPAPAQAQQPGLFDMPAQPDLTPRQDNPFLPKSVLARLQSSQAQASAQLRELMQTQEAPPPNPGNMEQELRLRLGPVIETLIEEHIQGLKAELRFRLRSEMEKLIAAAVKKP